MKTADRLINCIGIVYDKYIGHLSFAMTIPFSALFLPMLTRDEETFLEWWHENREKQKTSLRPLLTGLSAGLVLGIASLLSIASGWDKRAAMVASTRLSSVVFLLAILVISVFMAIIYRKFRWEMQEQQYLELLAKKNKAGKSSLNT